MEKTLEERKVEALERIAACEEHVAGLYEKWALGAIAQYMRIASEYAATTQVARAFLESLEVESLAFVEPLEVLASKTKEAFERFSKVPFPEYPLALGAMAHARKLQADEKG
jgi:hypothetical protein